MKMMNHQCHGCSVLSSKPKITFLSPMANMSRQIVQICFHSELIYGVLVILFLFVFTFVSVYICAHYLSPVVTVSSGAVKVWYLI